MKGKKTLAELAREFYNGQVDELTYRKKRAEILDHLEDKPVVDMDATLPLPQKPPRIEMPMGKGTDENMSVLPRVGWIVLGFVLMAIIMIALIASLDL